MLTLAGHVLKMEVAISGTGARAYIILLTPARWKMRRLTRRLSLL